MCDTMVTVSDDGVLFAKNSDRDPNEAQILEWVAGRDWPEGSVLRCTWIDIPQFGSTRSVMLSRPWWMWGAEMGTNDAGVTIGNEAVFTRESRRRRRWDPPALLGMDLVRLGLERAGSADDAVSVMIDLLERYGQGGPHSHDHPGFDYDNSFIIADPNSAVVLETAGRRWATAPVADGCGASISNGLTIEPFARAHSDRLRTTVASARQRCAMTSRFASNAASPVDLARALRSHGDSPAVQYSLVNGAMSAPCMHAGGLVAGSQTVASWIGDLRDGPLHWVTTTSAPCTSVFKPVWVDTPIDLGPPPANKWDSGCRWWRHEQLHRLALRDIARSVARFGPERDRTEVDWFADPPESVEAFDVASQLESGWLMDLDKALIGDIRPAWLRAYWRRLDAAAGIPQNEREMEWA